MKFGSSAGFVPEQLELVAMDCKALTVLILLQVGCHLGRPMVQVPALEVGRVVVPAAEPALSDALAGALSSALAARGLLGPGPEVGVRVLSAETVAVGADDAGRMVHRAKLVVEFQLSGPVPRALVLQEGRSYAVLPGASLEAASARAAAFESLAIALARDAALWLAYGSGYARVQEGNGAERQQQRGHR